MIQKPKKIYLIDTAFNKITGFNFSPNIGKYLENISSIKQWEKAIKLILEEQDLEKRFEKIADSRNEVLEYGPSKFLKNTFVFKRAVKGDELRGDYLTNLFLYELNRKSNEGLKLAKPLKFLSSLNFLILLAVV